MSCSPSHPRALQGSLPEPPARHLLRVNCSHLAPLLDQTGCKVRMEWLTYFSSEGTRRLHGRAWTLKADPWFTLHWPCAFGHVS